jgi:hypothetical protein
MSYGQLRGKRGQVNAHSTALGVNRQRQALRRSQDGLAKWRATSEAY